MNQLKTLLNIRQHVEGISQAVLAPTHETRQTLFLCGDQLSYACCEDVCKSEPGQYNEIILIPGDMHFHMHVIAVILCIFELIGFMHIAERIGRKRVIYNV